MKKQVRLLTMSLRIFFGRNRCKPVAEILAALSFYVALLLPLLVSAATVPTGFVETTVASRIESPTAMAIAPDGTIFVCSQTGALRVIKNGALLAAPFVSLSVDAAGERGLLGVAFDPDFAVNHYIYLYHTVPSNPPFNRVTRFTRMETSHWQEAKS